RPALRSFAAGGPAARSHPHPAQARRRPLCGLARSETAMHPDLASLIQSYADALERRDHGAAQEAVDAAIEVAPFDAEAWGCRGEFYRHYGRDLEEALACFQRAALLDPGCHLGPGCCAAVLEDLQQPW